MPLTAWAKSDSFRKKLSALIAEIGIWFSSSSQAVNPNTMMDNNINNFFIIVKLLN